MDSRAKTAQPVLPGSAYDEAPALLVLEVLDDEYWALREPGRARLANPLRDRYVATYRQAQAVPDDAAMQADFDDAQAAFLKELAGRLHQAKRSAICFSGGGIRSATFALGLVQALARKGLLKQIDVLSTVSGGGYAGSFIGALYARQTSPGAQEVERTLSDNGSWPMRWLRENGRYLSPNGSGDSWLAAAALLRNWVAVDRKTHV